MDFLSRPKRTDTRYLIEVEHRAWVMLDGPGRQAALEEELRPVLRGRAIVHRLSRIDGPELRDRHGTETPRHADALFPAPGLPALRRLLYSAAVVGAA
jgi:hypothetical protein